MLKKHALLIYRLLVCCDLAVTIAAFLAAAWVRWGTFVVPGKQGPLPVRDAWLLVVIVPAWFILLKAFGSYRSYRTRPFVYEMLALAKAVATGGLILGAAVFAAKTGVSRGFLLSFLLIDLLLLWLGRFAIRSLAWMIRGRGYNFRNLVVVGSGERARTIARRVENYREFGLRIIGFIPEDGAPAAGEIDGHRVLGSVADLEGIVKREIVDGVIFAVPGRSLEALEDTFLMLEEQGIEVHVVSPIFPHVLAKMTLEQLGTMPLLSFSTVPTSGVALAAKRLFDIGVSAALIVLSLPIMAASAIAIAATSPGGVLFRQQRCGLRGRIFTLYKFRSMHANAEADRDKLEGRNEMTGPVFKIGNDPRVTPLGGFLRRTSIDELPQLWNVLRGDMSIVGPRPAIPEEVSRYERWQRRRLSMRPGLTCIWQISGRSTINDFNEWVRLDLQYIDTWSLALDTVIFLKTIPAVLFRRGAA